MRIRRSTFVVPLALFVWAEASLPARAQLSREVVAATFAEGSSVKLSLASTAHLAQATGMANVRRRRGITEGEISAEKMQPAILFGGEYNTYVVWVISPEGRWWNAGELIPDGSKAKLKITTPLAEFGIMITAEPHFLAEKPSQFVVLSSTNTGLAQQKGVGEAVVRFTDFAKAYKFERENLAGLAAAKGQIRSDRHQAVIAVRFAEEAGAQEWAEGVFTKAQDALSLTQQAFAGGMAEKDLTTLAHRAVRLAVQAKRLAEQRRAAAQLADERQSNRETIESLQSAKAAAEVSVARLTQANSELSSRVKKTEKRLQEIEQAMLRANQEADQLARQKTKAEQRARAAQDQAAGFYVRMHDALGALAEIRETERGLVVNLPDAMFTSGSSRLQSGARETLAAIAGILLVAPEYHLSIEGHTDSTGRTAFNQKLSNKRAMAVMRYLDEFGISPAMMSARGYGESRPIASNRGAAGRKQNRRVEIVIEGLTRARP